MFFHQSCDKENCCCNFISHDSRKIDKEVLASLTAGTGRSTKNQPADLSWRTPRDFNWEAAFPGQNGHGNWVGLGASWGMREWSSLSLLSGRVLRGARGCGKGRPGTPEGHRGRGAAREGAGPPRQRRPLAQLPVLCAARPAGIPPGPGCPRRPLAPSHGRASPGEMGS